MKAPLFHHPRFNFTVLRRRGTEELLALTQAYFEFVATRGKSLDWDRTYPDKRAYYMAMHRLRRAGLVAYVIDGKHQVLRMTGEGMARLPEYHAPEKRWNAKWHGYWYTLMYDVPEAHRPNRHALRRFIKDLGMGCLQKSVWVTPNDIRPEYDDLDKAASIRDYAVLFESRTVLGYPDREIANRAWDFAGLGKAQRAYVYSAEKQLARVKAGRLTSAVLEQLGREEMQAYMSVMHDDPLLPKVLHPPGYQGPAVYRHHRRLVKAIGRARLRASFDEPA